MLRDDAYHYLADLIYRGFLFINVSLNGESFIFKTVNEKEYNIIKIRSGFIDSPIYNTKFNINYMIYSLFMAGGENVLSIKEEKYNVLYDFFLNMPTLLFNKILEELMKLKDIMIDVSGFMEGFGYTDQSRVMWKLLSGRLPYESSFTGISGTDGLGLNPYQEHWIRLNQVMDEEEEYGQKFSLALLVASASNPKGVRKMRSLHDASMLTTREKRKKLAKEGHIDRVSWSDQGWAARVDTAEELMAELNRQMSGLKDKHDNFVDDYLKELQERSEKHALEEQKKFDESRKRHEGEPGITVGQRALTPEEVEKMMPKKANNLVIVKSDEEATPDEVGRYYRKISTRVLTSKE